VFLVCLRGDSQDGFEEVPWCDTLPLLVSANTMPTPRLYIETSVVSYLTVHPSRDVVIAGQQQITSEWWIRRHRFELFASDAVIAEAGRGDPEAATRRLEALAGIPLLDATQDAQDLTDEILRTATMPPKAAVDAAHVAIATVHGLDFLLTWNCTHIANASNRPKIEKVCRSLGYQVPVICTPFELLEEEEQ